MIDILAELIDDFHGAANQTHCFLHILNLVVKSVIQQFNLSKAQKTSGSNDDDEDQNLDQATEHLLRLAGDIDLEEIKMANNDEEEECDNNNEGWIDECKEMTADELSELAVSIGPVRLLLTKVRLYK